METLVLTSVDENYFSALLWRFHTVEDDGNKTPLTFDGSSGFELIFIFLKQLYEF